jgi:hypothetical protein
MYGWQDGNTAVMPPYKEAYMDMQKVAKRSKITSFFTKSSVFLSVVHSHVV